MRYSSGRIRKKPLVQWLLYRCDGLSRAHVRGGREVKEGDGEKVIEVARGTIRY